MARKTLLPKSLSCTQIKKQWGIPSLRTEQDPERELMKRVPLQEINFVRQNLERDLAGGRKRKLPNETTSSYTSKPIGEPPIDQVRFSKLEKDLKKSKTQSILFLVIQSGRKSLHGREELPVIKREDCTCRPSELQRPQSVQSSKIYPEYRQGTEEWLLQRVGKITSSKGPYLIGLYGRRLFQESWDCIQKCMTGLATIENVSQKELGCFPISREENSSKQKLRSILNESLA